MIAHRNALACAAGLLASVMAMAQDTSQRGAGSEVIYETLPPESTTSSKPKLIYSKLPAAPRPGSNPAAAGSEAERMVAAGLARLRARQPGARLMIENAKLQSLQQSLAVHREDHARWSSELSQLGSSERQQAGGVEARAIAAKRSVARAHADAVLKLAMSLKQRYPLAAVSAEERQGLANGSWPLPHQRDPRILPAERQTQLLKSELASGPERQRLEMQRNSGLADVELRALRDIRQIGEAQRRRRAVLVDRLEQSDESRSTLKQQITKQAAAVKATGGKVHGDPLAIKPAARESGTPDPRTRLKPTPRPKKH